jgi:NAD(P)-dependent dehydrogenase (short-subunit alcohol dehydrogenase family)
MATHSAFSNEDIRGMGESMDLGLSGKTAIITGGSAGIGLACALALYEEGVSVVIAGRDAARLATAERAIRARPSINGAALVVTEAADMSRAEDVKRLVATALNRLGHIDIVVNNAGASRAGNFLDLDDEVYLETWTLKLLGYIRLVRAVVPHMIERRDGRIVNIIGAAGRTPGPTFLPGSTTNAALINFTRGVSRDLARHNIRINAISPGLTATDRAERLAQQNAAAAGISIEEAKARAAAVIPLGHAADPAEIAAMTLLLVSDRMASTTGAEVIIDGGQTPGM